MSELWKVAGVQMNVAFAEPEHNLQRMLRELEATAQQGARLTVFPECALTGYCFDNLQEAAPYAEPIPGPSSQQIADACQRLNMHCVFGMLEKADSQVFNAAVLVGPQGVIGSYRKIHLPYLGVDRFVAPGDRPFAVHAADPAKIGMHICYDGAFPEAVRAMMLQQADVVVLPTNWPPGAENMAEYMINTRAMENCVYYMAINRVGEERGFRFIGRSRICDIHGNTMAQTAHTEEAVLYAELDLSLARNKRIVRVPGRHVIDRLKDRRPEMYSDLVAPLAE